MIETMAGLLSVVYLPTMWFLMAVCLLLAALALLLPDRLRKLVRLFTRTAPARLLGIVLMLAGAELFVRSHSAAMSALVKILGVIFFIFGGACLVVPTLSVILAESWSARSNRWFRLSAVFLIALGLLFFVAIHFPPHVIQKP
jgi:hypothetical protein